MRSGQILLVLHCQDTGDKCSINSTARARLEMVSYRWYKISPLKRLSKGVEEKRAIGDFRDDGTIYVYGSRLDCLSWIA